MTNKSYETAAAAAIASVTVPMACAASSVAQYTPGIAAVLWLTALFGLLLFLDFACGCPVLDRLGQRLWDRREAARIALETRAEAERKASFDAAFQAGLAKTRAYGLELRARGVTFP